MNKKALHPKAIPAPVRHHLLKQQQSKQTIKAYCNKNDILTQTFYGWRKRYGKQVFVEVKTDISTPLVSFASLGTLKTQQPHHALFDICFPGRATICVYAGTTAQELAPFLDLVSRSCTLC